MRAIQIMFDSLNRRMLPPYGCSSIHAPNFARLASRTAVFDNAYVGSMPCMPARRELHTGRYNFLDRSWGPLEPFDDSMPELLKDAGIHSHLVSDHYHYWEDGGATYHTRYTTWDCVRGQEGDPWKGAVRPVPHPPSLNDARSGNAGSPSAVRDWANRREVASIGDFPQARTFSGGLEFLRANEDADDWFLHIETFDPHEPFFSHPEFKQLYPHEYRGMHFDWPPYRRVTEDDATVAHMRAEYAALLSMCDYHLGRILDFMDERNMWRDTMLIVNTDHGFLLGEHGSWAKCWLPFYDEVARVPLFIWDPREDAAGERRKSLVQTIDLAPTLLDFFDVPIPDLMQGKPLRPVLSSDQRIRDAGVFGIHGGHVNVTDGRYVYMRGPGPSGNVPLYEYTLMPTRHGYGRAFMEAERLSRATLVGPAPWSKDCPLLKVPGISGRYDMSDFGTLLFDTVEDPGQERPIDTGTETGRALEERLIAHLTDLMKSSDAPEEQYQRLGLS